MKAFWFVIILVSAFFIFFILPTMMFWTECAEETWRAKLWYTVKWELVLLICTSLILFISFLVLSKCNIPVEQLTCDMSKAIVSASSTD